MILRFLISFIFIIILISEVSGVSYLQEYPSGCDVEAAQQCEYDFLLCQLFNGPANDVTTLCNCATIYYGTCLRVAGCETHKQVGALTNHEIYMKTCIDFIMEYDCPNPLICGINCASDEQIDTSTTKVIPFNNYGQYYLRIKTCLFKVHEARYKKYSRVEQKFCSSSDYQICSRWIPPSSFVPVALPINTTYIEIDSCQVTVTNSTYSSYACLNNPAPVRVYGNSFLFPRSYDVTQTNTSVCSTDDDCLGSFCDAQYQPSICSPKTIEQVTGTGADYMSVY